MSAPEVNEQAAPAHHRCCGFVGGLWDCHPDCHFGEAQDSVDEEEFMTILRECRL